MKTVPENKAASVPTGPAQVIIPGYRTTALVGLGYALIVLVMWGVYNIYSGLPYETAFPYFSETNPWKLGFLYPSDKLRLVESTFYQLSYLLGEKLGIGGSYVPYQVVYALLWWARGFLVFLIVRKFIPKYVLLSYVAGALVLVHSSDGALQWVGQLNQFGFIFWMLGAIYLLTRALEVRWYFSLPLVLLSGGLEYMSLWSYESAIFLILAFPFVLILHPKRSWVKLSALAIAWYAVPAVYIRLTLQRYLGSAGHTYQESVVRKIWTVGSIASDWFFNVSFSLELWKWVRGPWKASVTEAVLLSLVVALIFLACGALLARWNRSSREDGFDLRSLCLLFASGLVLLLLSFPVYLVLDTARGLWRTQLLSGIGAGLVLTASAGLASQVVKPHARQTAVLLMLGSVVACGGSVAAIQKGALHRWIWERHRDAIREVLQVVPSVKPKTVIVLTNVPKDSDPFGHDMWYDMALRLIYPGTDVSGIYIYTDGTRSPGDNLVAKGDQWTWDGSGYPPLIRSTQIANTIIVRYTPGGRGALERVMPPYVCGSDCSAAGSYNPEALIAGPISPRTLRRYNLKPGF